jgi:NADPH2:quinone reductase
VTGGAARADDGGRAEGEQVVSTTSDMRAGIVTECGVPPTVGRRERPEPARGRVLVATTAVPLTPLDLLCASGTSYFGRPELPYVPGVQGVGRVAESTTLPTGTRVWFATSAGMAPGDGSLAEVASAREADVVPIEHDVEDGLVAALGLSAVAAWMVLHRTAGLRAGESVLVLGAGGVVGQVALQAARLGGATRVVGACRSPGAAERAAAAGADAVVRLDEGDDVAGLVPRLTDALDGDVDVVVDPLGGVPASAALLCLAPHGRLVNLGGSAGDRATFSSAHLRSGSRRILGYTNNDLTTEERADALGAVLGHAAAGDLHTAYEDVPLESIDDAWQRQADGRTSGRIVVRVD